MLKIIVIICFTVSLITNKERKTFKELINIYLNQLDINNAYLSYNQYISLLDKLKMDYTDYLEITSIGKTFEGREMPLIIMKSPISKASDENLIINSIKNINNTINNNSNNTNGTNETNSDNFLYKKSGIFFNGMHHGREPVSMMMNIYIILHLLSLPKSYLHLFLSITNIYFLPIINIDTYRDNCNKFSLSKSLNDLYKRKNRRQNTENSCMGVDLNRNYDYYFGENEKGSSDNQCKSDYRGKYPFSEPETYNIKKFVDEHPNIKIVFNYHSYGNIVIIPFNHLKMNDSLNKLKNDFPIHYKMYKDFKEEGYFPKNSIFGNSDKTIKSISNGEATDWFLGKKNILSFSLELGCEDKNSNDFLPNRNVTMDILQKNLGSALYAIQKSMFYFKSELLKAEYSPCSYRAAKYNEIYFNKKSFFEDDDLRDIELKNCLLDEIVLNVKINMTNYGYGTYIPGIEFNYNQLNNKTNYENENTKKYFYFLSLDLKINLDNIKSICYWVNSLNKTYNRNKKNKSNSLNDNFNEELKIRCENNKENELNNTKIFIDKEIKFLESIIINFQIIVKKDIFMDKKRNIKNKNRFLDTNYNKENNSLIINNFNNIDENKTNYLIKLYTKKERIIKSQNINNEIIEWKFNNPSIIIKIDEFTEDKMTQLIEIRQNPFKFLTYMIFSSMMMIFCIFTILRFLGLNSIIGIILQNSTYRNNNSRRFDIGYEDNVNNYENENQFHNRNGSRRNNQFRQYQIDRDEIEYSNSDSP